MTREPRSARGVPARVALPAVLLLSLAGCAGAAVTNVASRPAAAGPTPSEVLVAVDATVTDPAEAKAAEDVAVRLRTDLVHRLIEAHVTAEPGWSSAGHPGAALLRVSITRADPGSRLERIVLGFGLGKARLKAEAVLLPGTGPSGTSLTAFDTSSDSGLKPGLVVPGGVALATGDAIHLAIGGGVDIATNIKGGFDRPTRRTAAAIVKQLQKYYLAAGWT